jgi:hypothetical protein
MCDDWELIAPAVPDEWASFIVYVILFLFIVFLYKKELIVEWRKSYLFVLCVLSLILFDCIHIVRFSEFFYYLLPSVVLLWFYVSNKNNQ